MTVEQLYRQHIKPLSIAERLRLMALMAQHLASEATTPTRSWREICGAAAYPFLGEDAQAWVSRSRREGDEQRQHQWSSLP